MRVFRNVLISLLVTILVIGLLLGAANNIRLEMNSVLKQVALARVMRNTDTAKAAKLLENSYARLSSLNQVMVRLYFTFYPDYSSILYGLQREARYTKEAADIKVEDEIIKLDSDSFSKLYQNKVSEIQAKISYDSDLDKLLKKKMHYTFSKRPTYFIKKRSEHEDAEYRAREAAMYDEMDQYTKYAKSQSGYHSTGGYAGYSTTSTYSSKYSSYSNRDNDRYDLNNINDMQRCLNNNDCSVGSVGGDLAVVKNDDVL